MSRKKNRERYLREQRTSRMYLLSVVSVTVLTLVVGIILWTSQESQVLSDDHSEGWTRGAEDALVTIDAYPDFECGVCVEKEQLAIEALALYPDEVLFVYHHYPSDGFSHKLSESLEAAGEQGYFWELHDLIVERVPEDMTELSATAARVDGLDIAHFEADIESGKFAEKVREAKEAAEADGVQDIALFINGKEYEKYPGTLEDLKKAIDSEIERLGSGDGND